MFPVKGTVDKFCFSTLACPDWSWTEILRGAADSGYQGIEVRLLERQTDLLLCPEFRPARWAETRSQLGDAGLLIPVLSSSVRFDYPDRSEREKQLGIGARYLELAHAVGARQIRVFGDVLSTGEPAITFGNIVEGIQQLGERAQGAGVEFVVETHGDFAQSVLMAKLMRTIAHPAVGVLWDTHHPWRFFGESIRETFTNLAPWIRHTHWKDSIEDPLLEGPGPENSENLEQTEAKSRAHALMSGHRPAHYVLFGTGEFPWEEARRLLDEAGYRGWYSLEWEKAWHPELIGPEIALPQYLSVFQGKGEEESSLK